MDFSFYRHFWKIPHICGMPWNQNLDVKLHLPGGISQLSWLYEVLPLALRMDYSDQEHERGEEAPTQGIALDIRLTS